MSEKREPIYPSNNNGRNRSDEEIEETLEDEQEEKNGFSKIENPFLLICNFKC